MQNILVPTDFSPEAHNALEVALQLARRTGGHLTLLHVVDAPPTGGVITTGGAIPGTSRQDVFMVQLLAHTKRRMHQLMDEMAAAAPEVAVQDRIATGPLHEAVLDVLQTQPYDLVVVGAREHKPAWHLFTPDSLAEHLVRAAPCPVLTVKHPAPHFAVQSIVFASDFLAEADQMVPSLRELRAAFPEATLHLLDVVTAPGDYAAAIARIHAFARRHHLSVYEPDVYEAPQVSVGIPRYARQNHADLVVLLTHGHTGLSHLLHSGTAEAVAVQTAAPVLTLHPH